MRLFSELQAGKYAGVVLIWIIRGKKASHATAQIYIEHGKSN